MAAAEEWVQAGKPYVQKDIAATIALVAPRVSKWNRDARFRLAVSEIIKAGHQVLIETAHASLLQQAARGNLLAYNAVMDRLERHGRIKTVVEGPGADGTEQAPMSGVHVHLHAIPERQPMSALPPQLPPLTLPASPAGVATTPK